MRPARIDDYRGATGQIAETCRRAGIHSAVGCPIVVASNVWGVMIVSSLEPDVLPGGIEARLAEFAELLAAGIANTQARDELQQLAAEQAALRRVATLVARGTAPEAVFQAVADEAGTLLDCDVAAVVRFEPDGTVTIMGAHNTWRPPGTRLEPNPNYVIASVRTTGRAARFDTDDPMAPGMPEPVRTEGTRSALASPIVVDGRLWGTMAVGTGRAEPLPPDTEVRLGQFTELIATAIAKAEARVQLERLAEEQAALQRVATLVAEGAAPAAILDAVAAEMQRLLGADQVALNRLEPGDEILVLAHRGLDVSRTPVGSRVSTAGESATATVRRTGRPTRTEHYEDAAGPLAELARATGLRSSVSAPIVVKGQLWGVITASWKSAESPPADTEERVTRFSELVGTAVANTEAWAEVEQLAAEQGALRRVATLVAEEADLPEVFAEVAAEVSGLLGDADCSLFRDEGDGTATIVAQAGAALAAGMEVGTRLPNDGAGLIASVLRERRPRRIDDTAGSTGAIAERGRELGIRSAVGCPIVVRGRLWGAMGAGRYEAHAFAPETEVRIARFAELVATAVGNAEARAEVRRLVDEQAGLRRVATLVARGVQPAEVFTAVSREVDRLFPSGRSSVARFESGVLVVVGFAQRVEGVVVGSRWELDDSVATTAVYRTGRPARVDAVDWSAVDAPIAAPARSIATVSTVASPIVVEGQLWGAVAVSASQPLPPDTVERLEKFTELAATAIANTESRAEIERLADEQAALRRVATLVAEGASPTAVFDAAAAELGALLHAHGISLCRYEPGDELTVVAHLGPEAARLPSGTRVRHDSETVTTIVRRTQRHARLDSDAETGGTIGDLIGRLGFSAGVGAPIVVEGRLWGVTVANWTGDERPPPGTERRMAKFTELLGTAIANADSRDQLTASRARLLTAADEARRRVVRDLHDGAQQRLVHTIVTLKLAHRALRSGKGDVGSLVDEALDHSQLSNQELRELAHGIHPQALIRGGLRGAMDSVVERLDLPVDVDLPAERLPPEIEASAYFIVAEALTNVVKHAQAAHVTVTASVRDGMLYVQVRDDGIGGADPDGHGVVGMKDRVAALGGRFELSSPAGAGTCVAATLPLARAAFADSP